MLVDHLTGLATTSNKLSSLAQEFLDNKNQYFADPTNYNANQKLLGKLMPSEP